MRWKISGAIVIRSAESRPKPIVSRSRDTVSYPAVTGADCALVAAVKRHRAMLAP